MNGRLLQGCPAPFNVNGLKVKTPNGTVISGNSAKIVGAVDGTYTVTGTVVRVKDYHKYFTITIYGPA